MKLTERNQDMLFKVGLFTVAYLAFAKPILNFLGITKGAGEQLAVNLSSNANSPFNPIFWKKYLYFPPGTVKGKKMITAADATRLKESAESIVYGFGVLTDDEQQIFSGIKGAKTQAEISLISAWITTNWKKDMLQLLTKGQDIFPQNGLSDSELQQVFNYVRQLPIK